MPPVSEPSQEEYDFIVIGGGSGGFGGGGGILGLATTVLAAATGGAKFSKGDVKKIYFVRRLVSSFASPCLYARYRATG